MSDTNKFEISFQSETGKVLFDVPANITIRSNQSLSRYFSNDRLNKTFKNKTFAFLSTNIPPKPHETHFITYIEKDDSKLFPYSNMVTDALTRIFPQIFFRFERSETPQVRCINFDKNDPEKVYRKSDTSNTLVLALPFDSVVIGVSPFAVIIRCADGTEHLATLFNFVLSGVVGKNSFLTHRPISDNPPNIVSTLDNLNSSPETYATFVLACTKTANYSANISNPKRLTDLLLNEHLKVFGIFSTNPPRYYLDSVCDFLGFEPHPTLTLLLELKEKDAETLGNSAIVTIGSDLLLIRQVGTAFLIDKEGNAFVRDPTLNYYISDESGLRHVSDKSYRTQSLTAKYDSEINTRETLQKEASQYFSKSSDGKREFLSFRYFFEELIATGFSKLVQGNFFRYLREHLIDPKAHAAISAVQYSTPTTRKKFLIFDSSILFVSGYTTIMLVDNGGVAITFGRGHAERYYVTPSGALAWLYIEGLG